MKKNLLKGALASVIVLSTVAFTNIKKQIDVKSSTVVWTGKKVTGEHSGNSSI